jgi:hypothetical protein
MWKLMIMESVDLETTKTNVLSDGKSYYVLGVIIILLEWLRMTVNSSDYETRSVRTNCTVNTVFDC